MPWCLLLILLLSVALLRVPGGVVSSSGSHSLSYAFTVKSQDGSVQSKVLAKGFLDGQCFLYYDSDKGGPESRGQWAKAALDSYTKHTEMVDMTESGKDLRRILAEVMDLQDRKGGLHSLQEIRGCEIQEDNSARGFLYFLYNEEPFLLYDPKTLSWTVPPFGAQTLAMKTKGFWDGNGSESKNFQAQVQGELCGRLQKYLILQTDFMKGTVSPVVNMPPAVNITCSQTSEGKVALTCWAFGFSPRNISLAWFQDDTLKYPQQSGGVLPDGRGTYQMWVSTEVPKGEEQRFTCSVKHNGKHSVHPVSSGFPERHIPWCLIILVPVAVAAIVAAVWCKKRRQSLELSREKSEECINLRDQGRHLMAPEDPDGTRQLGFQPQMSAPRPTDSMEGA